MKAEPVPSNEVAFERHRALLVLRREHQAADLGLDPIQHRSVLSLRMQDVTAAASDVLVGSNRDDAVLLRNGWQVEMIETIFLSQSSSRQDPPHARCMTTTIGSFSLSLSLETGVPPNHSITRRRAVSDIASSALSGSSTTMRSAPRPVSVPPTEVA